MKDFKVETSLETGSHTHASSNTSRKACGFYWVIGLHQKISVTSSRILAIKKIMLFAISNITTSQENSKAEHDPSDVVAQSGP